MSLARNIWKSRLRMALAFGLLLLSLGLFNSAFAEIGKANMSGESSGSTTEVQPAKTPAPIVSGKGAKLVASFTVFLLAVFVGVEVINKVPPTLHTPLMSGSNAISGITIIGALLAAGHRSSGFGAILGLIAVVLAMINIAGGFLVTNRMLMMFKKR